MFLELVTTELQKFFFNIKPPIFIDWKSMAMSARLAPWENKKSKISD